MLPATKDVPRFRFTQLPVNAAKNVLWIMSPIHLIVYSLISKKCKLLTQSVGIRAEPIICRITQSIPFIVTSSGKFLMYVQFKIEEKENGKYTLKALPKKVRIGFRRNDIVTRELIRFENRMGVREWLEHLQFLFACPKSIAMIFTVQSFQFDIHSLRETFHDRCHELEVYHTGCYAFNNFILREFLPVTSCLSVSPSCFQNSRIPPFVLAQNTQRLNIMKRDDGNLTHLELDDLLLINARIIRSEKIIITLEALNKFLKLWINGLDPHLEFMSFGYINRNAEDANTVMRGINYESMPSTLAREHRSSRFIVQGGMDFYRYDGVKATICLLSASAEVAGVAMFVWHDHN